MLDDYLKAKSLFSSAKGFTEPAAAVADWAKEQALRWAVPGAVYAIAKKYLP